MPGKTKSIKYTDLKAEKPWLKKVRPLGYRIESIEKRKRFLIVCEGQTEELYFKSFPVVSAVVASVHQGTTKTNLVECVVHYTVDETYDEIWCVFDRDCNPQVSNQNNDYDNAILLAKKLGYRCAYSNDAFELWFVLHYQFIEQEHLRQDYFNILSDYWNLNYAKGGKERKFCLGNYNRLLNDLKASQQFAIKNAKKLCQLHVGKEYHLQNPVTIVYQLVEELNLYLRN